MRIIISFCALVAVFMIGCEIFGNGDGDDGSNGSPATGTLTFDLTVVNAGATAKAARRLDTMGCRLVDTRHTVYSIDVAIGDVIAGQPDTLNWQTIYSSSEEMLDSKRSFPPVQLAPGTYNAIRIEQSNGFHWIVACGADTVELQNYNDPQRPADARARTNVFGTNGLCYYGPDSTFQTAAAGEKLGGFTITAGDTTQLTFQVNIDQVRWHDNDNSGTWTEGDAVGEVSLAPGCETMTDFIVVYQ